MDCYIAVRCMMMRATAYLVCGMSFGAVLLIGHVIVLLVPRRGSKEIVSN